MRLGFYQFVGKKETRTGQKDTLRIQMAEARETL